MCICTVYPKKYARGFCFAVLCCGYTLTDFPISIRLTSLALWQSSDCPSASKATLMNMDKYFMWIHYEQLHNHNKAKHNKTVCIFLGIYCNWYSTCRTAFLIMPGQIQGTYFWGSFSKCIDRRWDTNNTIDMFGLSRVENHLYSLLVWERDKREKELWMCENF